MPAVEPSTQPREVRLLPAEQPSLQQPGRAPRGVAVLPLQLLACRQRLPPELSRRHSPGTERRRRKLRVTELSPSAGSRERGQVSLVPRRCRQQVTEPPPMGPARAAAQAPGFLPSSARAAPAPAQAPALQDRRSP